MALVGYPPAVSDRRTCTAAARLIRVWMSVPHEPWYAAELARAAELPAGTLYPLLAQLERARWITGFWEPRDPLAPHRSPRRYYRLTVDGHDCAQEAFSNASAVSRSLGFKSSHAISTPSM